MAGDLPPRRPSTTLENPLAENPEAAANPGNLAGTSNVPENVTHRNGKGPAIPRHSANQGVDSRHYAEQGYQLTAAEQEVIRLNRILAETTRQLEEARARRAPVAPETIHLIGETKLKQPGQKLSTLWDTLILVP